MNGLLCYQAEMGLARVEATGLEANDVAVKNLCVHLLSENITALQPQWLMVPSLTRKAPAGRYPQIQSIPSSTRLTCNAPSGR
jgi:hypothetical protein